MVKFFITILKLTTFIAIILVSSQLIKWNGKSVSDQVKTSLSSVEGSAFIHDAKRSTTQLLEDAKEAVKKHPIRGTSIGFTHAEKKSASLNPNSRSEETEESITDQEKKELQALFLKPTTDSN